MIVAWLAKSFLGLPRWIFVLLAFALLLAGLLVWISENEEADDQRNREVGRTEERTEALEETVERVEEANEVRDEVEADIRRGGSDVLYRQCMSSNRGAPENCERFLPQR